MEKLEHIELYVLLIQLICLLGISKFFGGFSCNGFNDERYERLGRTVYFFQTTK